MSSSEAVLREFYSRLVEILPMDNVTFVAILFSSGLLSRELKNKLNLPHSDRTSAEKAMLFLDSVIEPSVSVTGSGVGSCFDMLLNVMENYEHQGVNELAKLIRTSLSNCNENG